MDPPGKTSRRFPSLFSACEKIATVRDETSGLESGARQRDSPTFVAAADAPIVVVRCDTSSCARSRDERAKSTAGDAVRWTPWVALVL